MSDPSRQVWNPAAYDSNARFVTDLGMPVVELLAPCPGERILDLGCGDGPLTAKLAALGCDVVGIDGSPAMVAAARALGLDARLMDAQALEFNGEFDAVFSNAALHWMPRGADVAAGVWRALRPGGRFVGEFGGRDNVAAITTALNQARVRRGFAPVTPWFNPGPGDYAALLVAQGFEVLTMEHFPRPTTLPGSIRAWLETFTAAFTGDLPPAEHAGLHDEVVRELQPALRRADGSWFVDYVRLRFAARRPAVAGAVAPR
jgi:trans-aconitate methyltransferase